MGSEKNRRRVDHISMLRKAARPYGQNDVQTIIIRITDPSKAYTTVTPNFDHDNSSY
jgi:hypothetical protein